MKFITEFFFSNSGFVSPYMTAYLFFCTLKSFHIHIQDQYYVNSLEGFYLLLASERQNIQI